MRYRRLSYRYVVLTGNRLKPLGHVSPIDRPAGLAQFCWLPPADVLETPDAMLVTVELAGVDESEIEILLFEDTLVISGHRRLPRPEGEAVYQAAEIRQGPYRLEVPVTSRVDADRVGATYERGILSVILPRAGGA